MFDDEVLLVWTGMAISHTKEPQMTVSTQVTISLFDRIAATLWAIAHPFYREELPSKSREPMNAIHSGQSVNDVLSSIEDGYWVEETGEFVRLPPMVRKQIQARLKCGDWC